MKISKKKALVLWGVVAAVALAAALWWRALPDPLFDDPLAAVLYSQEGQLLAARVAEDGQWRFEAGDSLPQPFVQALLRFEDRHFFQHPGVNPVAMVTAAWANVRQGKVVRGGSTLSMQVIRLSRKGQPRTVWEKVKEIVLALRLELRYSKSEILALYAANAPFGGNVVGLEAAAWRYFGRGPHQLSWSECAALAVLPNAPSLVRPGKNEGVLRAKRDRLLQGLQAEGLLTQQDVTLAMEESLPGVPVPLPRWGTHLLSTWLQQGHRGALESTLHADLQQRAEATLQGYVATHLRPQQVHNAAALVVEVATGNVVAYVGNDRTAGHRHGAQVDVLQSRRSPGSLLKPVLYAAALDDGLMLPGSLLPDVPKVIDGFAPENFHRGFSGAVPADEALQRSLNVPFVLLLQQYRYERFHQLLQRLGFASLSQPAGHYGLSLILGGGDITPAEAAGAYASLGRALSGYTRRGQARYAASDIRPIWWDSHERPPPKESQDHGLVSAGALWHTFLAMEQVQRPGADGAWQRYSSSRRIAWKTGTSYGHRDAWALGMTPEYLVVVWAGNADGEGRPGLTGIQAAAPLLFQLFSQLPETGWWHRPESDLAEVPVYARSGNRAPRVSEVAALAAVPRRARTAPLCPYYQRVWLSESGQRVSSACIALSQAHDTLWMNLPPAMAWFYRRQHAEYRPLPRWAEGCRPEEDAQPSMAMIYPESGAQVAIPRLLSGERSELVLQAAHTQRQSTLHWHLDETYLGSTSEPHRMPVQPAAGQHRLVLVDQTGQTLEIRFEVVG